MVKPFKAIYLEIIDVLFSGEDKDTKGIQFEMELYLFFVVWETMGPLEFGLPFLLGADQQFGELLGGETC